MRKLSLAFFGTPSYSAYLLERIINDKELPVEVKLVVTQPDRPVGKKQIITPSPVKMTALKIKNLDIENSLKIENWKLKIKGVDLALVCAYGQILPKEILTVPKYGFWNIHYSLLPKYRGGSPSAYALMLGDKTTGTTILQMDEKLDHGPIIAQQETEILPDERRPELEMRLTDMTFELFKKTINGLAGLPRVNELKTREQDHSQATYAKLLKKEDGFIPFVTIKKALKEKQLVPIYHRFRGLYPWPGLWTFIAVDSKQKRLKITDMDNSSIKRVQLEGKKEVDFTTFKRAYL